MPVLALVASTLVACGGARQIDPQDLTSDSDPVTISYTGGAVTYTVPPAVSVLNLVASGGAGGHDREDAVDRSRGAQVSGTVAVHPGQLLLVSVGGEGKNAGSNDSDPSGGWGGLGAHGGNGNAAHDTLRSSGAGGGATTIQLVNADGSELHTILIAGGGGGSGGPSGDPGDNGQGGYAGCLDDGYDTPSWLGDSGDVGSGGQGGAPGGQSAMAGGRGWGGSEAGGNGGAGGGGLHGGDAGSGASTTEAGGGGGAGSSITLDMLTDAITCAPPNNGQVTVSPQSS